MQSPWFQTSFQNNFWTFVLLQCETAQAGLNYYPPVSICGWQLSFQLQILLVYTLRDYYLLSGIQSQTYFHYISPIILLFLYKKSIMIRCDCTLDTHNVHVSSIAD